MFLHDISDIRPGQHLHECDDCGDAGWEYPCSYTEFTHANVGTFITPHQQWHLSLARGRYEITVDGYYQWAQYEMNENLQLKAICHATAANADRPATTIQCDTSTYAWPGGLDLAETSVITCSSTPQGFTGAAKPGGSNNRKFWQLCIPQATTLTLKTCGSNFYPTLWIYEADLTTSLNSYKSCKNCDESESCTPGSTSWPESRQVVWQQRLPMGFYHIAIDTALVIDNPERELQDAVTEKQYQLEISCS